MKSNRDILSVGLVFLFSLGLFGGCSFSEKKDPPNTLRTAVVAKIKGMDPVFTDDMYSSMQVSYAYEGLLQYHFLKRPYVLVPNLAEEMPEITDGGKTLTFKIKKGVLFQDDPCFAETKGKGRELTAEDFIYSFKRLADPKNVSPGWWIFDGKILGLNEWREAASKGQSADYAKPVEGLKATDRYTLQIKLKERSAQFLYFLAMSYTFAVPKEAVTHYGKEFQNHPVGTGPFKLEEFNPAAKIVWVKNPTYRKELYPSEGTEADKAEGRLEDAGKPIPFLDKIVVRVLSEDQPRWLEFMAGNLDSIGIPKDNFNQALASNKELKPELKAKGIRLAIDSSLDLTSEHFNMEDPVVGKNKLLRQAISLAIDPDKMNELFFAGKSLVAQGPIPPNISGYDPNFKNPFRKLDIEKAKELMKKAGFPEGKGLAPIEYLALDDTTSRQMNEYLGKALEAIGVKLKFSTFSWPQFQEAVKNKKGQMWGMGWGADYPDAENFLQLFYSKNKTPGPNDSCYSNPAFDHLYEKALTLMESPERTKLYQEMQKIVVEDSPWIFSYHRQIFSLVQPWLKNSKYHEFDNARVKYYRIDSSLKK